MGKVTTAEALHIRIAKSLRLKGYEIGDQSSSFLIDGILQKSNQLLWWKWNSNELYRLGVLYIDDQRIGAQGKNWVIHVTGRKNMDRLMKLAEGLATEFDVDVHVRLEKEELEQIVACGT